MNLEAIEKERRSLQNQLDSSKTQEERNQSGQFATPYELACQLMSFAEDQFSDGKTVDFLEPAVGTGPFLSALFSTFSDRQIGRVRGVEMDGDYLQAARQIWSEAPVQLSKSDFTKLDPPMSRDERFNLLVTNPPYVRHHHLAGEEKKRLQKLSDEMIRGGIPSGYTGLYCYFMYLAHNWLREGGVAGWLVPTEFTEVGYGNQLRRYLREEVTLLRVHQYRPEDLQFDSALVSSCVVWYRKKKPEDSYEVEFSFGGTHSNPERVLTLSSSTLADLKKWNLLSLDNGGRDNGQPTVNDVFEIKRGIATGDNDFFILDEEEVEKFDLPDRFLKPILPSPRYLEGTIIEANDDGTPDIEKRLWLLSCLLTEDAVKQHPSLWRYLQRGKEEGVHEGYLCRNRSVWYHQEHREPAPFLCKYMGRESFGFFLNRSEAIASNNLTMMYPNQLLEAAIEEDPGFKEKLILLLSEVSESAMRQGGRTYGGGMTKVEPGELEEIPIPGLKTLLSEVDSQLEEALESNGALSLF